MNKISLADMFTLMHLGKSPVKILICVIHGPYEPWLTILREGQIKTWMSQDSAIKIVNVFGKAIPNQLLGLDQSIYFKRWSQNRFVAYLSLGVEAGFKTIFPIKKIKPSVIKSVSPGEPDSWTVQMPDSLLLQGVKNLAAFRASLDEDYDYLVTTITSSYINLRKLAEHLTDAEQKSFVGGRIEESGDMQYQQGSFRVFSRDVVEYIVNNSSNYKHWLIEDIAMGRLVNLSYTKFTKIDNFTLHSAESVKRLTKSDLSRIVSYRCKSIVGNTRTDHEIMQALNERLTQL